MKLSEFVSAVRRYWLTFILAAGVVFALCLTWVLLLPAKYASTTQLMVSIDGSTTAAAYENDEVVLGRVNSYIALLTSGAVDQRVIDKLGLPLTASDLAAKISVANVPPKTAIIDVKVTAESPEVAQLIAKTLASEFISYADALETPTGEDGQKVHTTVVTPASEARGRSGERAVLAVLGGLAALLLGAIAVWIRSRTDPVVRTADEAAVAAGVPVIGCVTAGSVASVDDLEGYRRLRTRLRSMTNGTGEPNDRGRVLVLTSAVGEVETASVASNLERAMELAGSRTITMVLDAHVPGAGVASDEPLARRASGNEPNPGGAEDTDKVGKNKTESNDGSRIDVVTPPKHRRPESEHDAAWDQLATKGAAEPIERLRSEHEHVIIAAPSVLLTIAAPTTSEYADGVVIVAAVGKTRRRDLRRAADKLRATGAPLTGAVLIGKDNSGVGSGEFQ